MMREHVSINVAMLIAETSGEWQLQQQTHRRGLMASVLMADSYSQTVVTQLNITPWPVKSGIAGRSRAIATLLNSTLTLS